VNTDKPARRQDAEVPLAPYWLPAIIESADDAIISKTLEGIITSWNKAAERIFGFKADEIIGKSVLTIIPPQLHDEETYILSKLRNGERIDHFETIRLRKDGTVVDISLSISPILTADGTVIGASKIARDITDQKRVENERKELLKQAEEARHEAEAANKAKDNFLALLSHELRTPLHSMRGWLAMLSNGLLTDEQRKKALDVILRGIDSQNALIEDLLDVSRIVSGKMSIDRETVSLVSIINSVIEQQKPIAIDNDQTLNAELDYSADQTVGDEARLQQVLTNLVNNAIKYTPKGGTVDVSLDRNDDKAVITVADTGVGIAPEMIGRIFERFEQADSSSRRSFGGLGLGLTIAKHIVDLHEGRVYAQSAGEGKGSTFVVELPLVKVFSPARMSGTTNARDMFDQGLDNLRVLIVEDDQDSLEMLRIVLEKHGADVTSVDRGQAAVEVLNSGGFDLIISDLGLPGMDGFDLIREIREKLGIDAQQMPAIALSGYVAEHDRHRSLSNGFQLHLQKPLDVSTLADSVRSVLDRMKQSKN
jgi:PAS domain S-box-containing protein